MIKLQNKGVTLQGGVPTPAEAVFPAGRTRPWLIRSSAAMTDPAVTDRCT